MSRLPHVFAVVCLAVFAAAAAAPIVDAQPMRQGPGGAQGGGQGAGARPGGGPIAPGQTPNVTITRSAIPWVDVHTHMVAAGPPGPNPDYLNVAEVMIQAMDEAGVRASIVMPTPQPPNLPRAYDLDSFLPAVKAYPGRLYAIAGGGSLGPMILENPDAETVDEGLRQRFAAMAEAMIDAGAIGFGEMTAHHLSHAEQHSYHRAHPDHPLFLLLADIAARRNVVIDLHMDPVETDLPKPAHLTSSRNPPVLQANVPRFEKLLAHNRDARIVWAHAGWDQTETWSPALTRRLLRAHPNLFVSLKATARAPGSPPGRALDMSGKLTSDWRALIVEFSDRFVMGTDRFYASPMGAQGGGAPALFSRSSITYTAGAVQMLSQLPEAVARKVASENVARIYGVKLE